MKKLFVLTLLLCAVSMGYAQKVLERMEDTQARLLDVTSKGYVRPLTVEVEIDQSIGRLKKTVELSKTKAEIELSGKLENIRSWAIYKVADELNVDVIVAPTINVRTNDKGDGYEVIVIGYAGNYKNWATATEADYEWMRIERDQSTSKYGVAPIVK